MTFDPKSIRYDASGVPYLRAQTIEQVACEVLTAHGPRTLDLPGPTPVADVLDGLALSTGLRVQWGDLGFKGGNKILGKVSFPQMTLFLDAILEDEQKTSFPFTAAHEIGHWMLHRHKWCDLRLEGGAGFAGEFSDNQKSLSKLDPQTPREWLEFQANVFAASMVMPWGPFQKAAVTIQMQLEFERSLGEICPSNADPDTSDFRDLVSGLASTFAVSRASVEMRFRAMQLIIAETGEPESVISQIVSKAAHTVARQR